MEKSLPVWAIRLREKREQRSWTQANVAEKLNTNAKTVGRWERGESKPGLWNQREVCRLFETTALELGFVAETSQSNPSFPLESSTHTDWGKAPARRRDIYGRVNERARLRQWIQEGSHIIAVSGVGGIGKTTLVVNAIEEMKQAFQHIFWRSLSHMPDLETNLRECLRFFSGTQQVELPTDLESQLSLLLKIFKQQRCLLILDNIDSILQSGNEAGHWRQGCEGYGRLIERIGEAKHQSCLILTSRENLTEVARAEGSRSYVHSLLLTGLNLADGKAFLQDLEVFGPDNMNDWQDVISFYAGSPLALELIADTIKTVFGGDITRFVKEGDKAASGKIQDLLHQQFHRLSQTEQEVMYWLAVEQEPVLFNDLRENIVRQASKQTLQRAVESLRKRSMIEPSYPTHFTLQPVIMEYMHKELINEVCREIETCEPGLLARHALMKAQTKDYVRDNQIRFILEPLTQCLLEKLERDEIEERFKTMLATLQQAAHKSTYPYLAGNLLNLLIHMRYELRGYDFSHVFIRQAYLQGALLPDVNLAHASIDKCVFTDTFGNILSVAFNPQGDLLAAGTTSCEIRVWHIPDSAPRFNHTGHNHWVRSVAFSPDGMILASSSEDRTIRLWDTHTGSCLTTLLCQVSYARSITFSPDSTLLAEGGEDHQIRLWDIQSRACLRTLEGHSRGVSSVAFSPDGKHLVSSSEDQTIRLWDVQTGLCSKVLTGHTNEVNSVTFSPNGMLIASGSKDQTIRLWDAQTGLCKVLRGHTSGVSSVAFSPNSEVVASGSKDQTVRFWDVQTGYCSNILSDGTNEIACVIFSPDGRTLAGGSNDRTVRLWNVTTGRCINSLKGYTNGILSVVFSPESDLLASGSEDSTIQLWDNMETTRPRILQGHTSWVWSLAFSPNGTLLASGSEDSTVQLWNVQTGTHVRTFNGHTRRVSTVAFSADGNILASGSEDHAIRLWDIGTAQCLATLNDHTNRVESLAFSLNGKLLASGSEDETIRLWDVPTRICLNTLRGHTNRVRTVAFSPDGQLLASGSYDRAIRLWDVATGHCKDILEGHTDYIRCVTFNPDGRLLASCSYDHTIRLWDVKASACIKILQGHTDWIRAVMFSADGRLLASGSRDGTIRYWDVQTGTQMKSLRTDRPYERMNITGIKGLDVFQVDILRSLGAIIEAERL